MYIGTHLTNGAHKSDALSERRVLKMRHESESSSLAAIKTPISPEALDQLFREARTHSTWLPEPAPVDLLSEAYKHGVSAPIVQAAFVSLAIYQQGRVRAKGVGR
jgi:hypothetical protein